MTDERVDPRTLVCPSLSDDRDVSVRRHSSFGLLERTRSPPAAASQEALPAGFEYVAYAWPVEAGREDDCAPVLVRQRVEASRVTLAEFSVAQSSGVDNTGNVCLWPAEEVLAWYCCRGAASDAARWAGKRVLELGAGVGVAAFLLARAQPGIDSLLVTDGNPLVAETLAHNVAALGDERVAARELRWDRSASFDDVGPRSFDVILGADCLFFRDYHIDLLHTLDALLADDGLVLFIAPERPPTLDLFLAHADASAKWNVTVTRDAYDATIWAKHERLVAAGDTGAYDPAIHYPLRIEMQRRAS